MNAPRAVLSYEILNVLFSFSGVVRTLPKSLFHKHRSPAPIAFPLLELPLELNGPPLGLPFAQGSVHLTLRHLLGVQARSLFPRTLSPCTQDLAAYFCLATLPSTNVPPMQGETMGHAPPRKYTEADLFEVEGEDAPMLHSVASRCEDESRANGGAAVLYSSELAWGTLAPEWGVIDTSLLAEHTLRHCVHLRVSVLLVALPTQRACPLLARADPKEPERSQGGNEAEGEARGASGPEGASFLEGLRATGLQRWAKLPGRNWKVRRRGDSLPSDLDGVEGGGEIWEEEVVCVDVDLRRLERVEGQPELGPNSLLFQATDGCYRLPDWPRAPAHEQGGGIPAATTISSSPWQGEGPPYPGGQLKSNVVSEMGQEPGVEEPGEERMHAAVSLEQLQAGVYDTGAAGARLGRARARREGAREAVEQRGEVRAAAGPLVHGTGPHQRIKQFLAFHSSQDYAEGGSRVSWN
jgi:hypothetical protein